ATLLRGSEGVDGIERRWGGALQLFAITLVVLLTAYLLLRLLAAAGFARLNRWIEQERSASRAQPDVPHEEPGTPPTQAGVPQEETDALYVAHLRLPPLRLSRKLLGVVAAGVIDLA